MIFKPVFKNKIQMVPSLYLTKDINVYNSASKVRNDLKVADITPVSKETLELFKNLQVNNYRSKYKVLVISDVEMICDQIFRTSVWLSQGLQYAALFSSYHWKIDKIRGQ